MADRVGQRLGNYHLMQLLGRGGFAEVYKGEHFYLNTMAAIKVHGTELTTEEINQFRNEARIIAHLKHPNIVQVLDFDVEENIPFLVMDYASNGTLRNRYPKGNRIPLTSVVTYVKQIASALQYAHNQKLIHRDIKPENMLLGQRNEVLLSDFGIAVIAQSANSLITREMAGTVPYMAPEQILGKPQLASDQYALGIVVYEWLSGAHPFHGSQPEIIFQHLNASPPSLEENIPEVPSQVINVVMKVLNKDPQERYDSVQKFADALELASQPISSTIRVPQTYFMPSLSSLPNTKKAQRIIPASPSPGTLILRYSGHFDMITGMAWSPDGKNIATVGRDGFAQIWNPTTGRSIFKCSVLSKGYDKTWMEAVAWSPDGTQIAFTCSNGTIEVWNVTDKKKMYTYDNRKNKTGKVEQIHALAWSPTGENIAFTSTSLSTRSEFVKVWRLATTQKTMFYKSHSSRVNSFVWSPDGKSIASASSNVQVWSAATGGRTFIFHNKSSRVNDVKWSPDGKYIAFATDDKEVEIWNSETGTNILTYHGHSRLWGGQVNVLAWSPDGKYIASGGTDKTIQIWNVQTGNLISNYLAHTKSIEALVWSPNGQYIASISHDITVHIWNAFTDQDALLYNGHSDRVLSIAWSPDGTLIASRSRDTTVQVWQAL